MSGVLVVGAGWAGAVVARELQDAGLDVLMVTRPSLRVPFTRTVETKHATAQRVAGTVVSQEYPGARARHYPVPGLDGAGQRHNEELQAEIGVHMAATAILFCGRLATYRYSNQDQAIEDGLRCAAEVLGRRMGKPAA